MQGSTFLYPIRSFIPYLTKIYKASSPQNISTQVVHPYT